MSITDSSTTDWVLVATDGTADNRTDGFFSCSGPDGFFSCSGPAEETSDMPEFKTPSESREIKSIDFEVKGESAAKTLRFVGTDESVDRVGDIIRVKGWKFQDYLKNPVFLYQHNGHDLPIGIVRGIQKRRAPNPRIEFTVEFLSEEENPLAPAVYRLFKRGIMGVSVGFKPLKWQWRTTKEKGDKEERVVGREFLEQELIELSAVTIPANPNALLLSFRKSLDDGDITWKQVDQCFANGIITEDLHEELIQAKPKFVEEDTAWSYVVRDRKRFDYTTIRRYLWKNTLPRIFGESGFIPDEERGALHRLIFIKSDGWTSEDAQTYVDSNADKIKQLDGLEIKGALPYKKYPLAAKDTPWNGPKETAAAEVEDLRKMCAWVDPEKSDVKSGYKLPHHKASGFTTVWAGVKAAGAATMGARGGVKVPEADLSAVRSHLAQHYGEFDAEPPWEKAAGRELQELREFLDAVDDGQEESGTTSYVRALIVNRISKLEEELFGEEHVQAEQPSGSAGKTRADPEDESEVVDAILDKVSRILETDKIERLSQLADNLKENSNE